MCRHWKCCRIYKIMLTITEHHNRILNWILSDDIYSMLNLKHVRNNSTLFQVLNQWIFTKAFPYEDINTKTYYIIVFVGCIYQFTYCTQMKISISSLEISNVTHFAIMGSNKRIWVAGMQLLNLLCYIIHLNVLKVFKTSVSKREISFNTLRRITYGDSDRYTYSDRYHSIVVQIVQKQYPS